MNGRSKTVLAVIGVIALATLYLHSSSFSTAFLPGKADFDRRMTTQLNETTEMSDSTAVLIIVLAYMHTGSSYTGSIFQQHPGSYYHYEALRILQNTSRSNNSIHYLNGFHRSLSGEWLQQDVALEAVHNMLHCKYGNIDINTLLETHSYKSTRFRDQMPYLKCLLNHRKNRNFDRTKIIRTCLPRLITPCLKANIRAFKFIRLPMAAVERLLKFNDNLRVIHLVRDPRAMLDSQVRKNNMGSRTLSKFTINAKRLCDKMHDDFHVSKSFPAKIRQKIQLVRYEDLTDKPLDVVTNLFHFTRVPLIEQDRIFIKQTTRKENNATRSKLDTWRRHLAKENLDILNQLCGDVYKDYGYIEYASIADIRDRDKPTYLRDDEPFITRQNFSPF